MEDAEELVFRIEADGFLYRMVRGIVGALVRIGRGDLEAAAMERLLRGANRALAGPAAPAHGLHLWRVSYGAGGDSAGEAPGRINGTLCEH